MLKLTDRLQQQKSRVLKTRNGTTRTKFSKGDPVTVNTGGEDTPAEIVSGENKPYYWLIQNSYLCRFENGTTQYIPAKYLKLNWNEKENKPPQRNGLGKVQDNIDNGEVIRLI